MEDPYLQYRVGAGFFRADGRLAGTGRNLPLASSRGDLVQAYNSSDGRSWVMDVADDPAGRPVIVYSVGFARSRQYFKYARWTGKRWLRSRIAPAYDTRRSGDAAGKFQTGGIVLDHRDPSTVYLTRVAGNRGRVEQWRTPDRGRSWSRVSRLSPVGLSCFRPAAPVTGPSTVVLFVCGRLSHWQRYATTIRTAVPPHAWTARTATAALHN